MEIKTIELLTEQAKKLLPQRKTEDNKCFFCKKDLSFEKWCDCLDSEKINWKYKKITKKLGEWSDRVALEDTEYKKRLLSLAGIPQKFNGVQLEDFIPKTPLHKKVKTEFEQYFNNSVENWITGRNLILLGNFGTGKTMLECILGTDTAYNKNFTTMFLNLAAFVEQVKDSFSDSTLKPAIKQKIQRAKDADFLVLDDIDKVEPTQYVIDFLYGITDHRILKLLPTVISANSTFTELNDKYFGEAITSRLYENSQIIKFELPNWRIKH